MSFISYSEYGNSGIGWGLKLPSHWRSVPLKYTVRLLTDKASGREFPVSMENVESWSGRFLETDSEYVGDGVAFECGDILFGKLRPYLAKAWLADRSGEAVGDFYVFRPRKDITPKFLQYVVLNDSFISIVNSSTYGAKMPRVSWGFMGALNVPIPPLPEQIGVVTFLDRETSKIDSLISEQEKLISLLKEKRQSVITHVVTKGLNPSVPMKDSGIEWLGDIPENWEVRRLSTISTKITNGYVGPTRGILVNEGVRYLQSLHIKGNRIKFNVEYYVSEEWSKQHRKSILEAGDVLIVQTGDIGQVAVVTEEFAGSNCHALIIVSPNKVIVKGEWMSLALYSDYGLHSLLSIQTGALHPHLNCGNVKDLFIPLPSMEEQYTIINFIERETAKIDQLLIKAQRAINLLKERRTALITAAVTGKIDVRQYVQEEV